MKRFAQYKKEYDAGKVNRDNPNVDTVGFERKAIQYKNQKLRKAIYQPKKQLGVYRRNKIFNAERFANQVITKIKEGTMLTFKQIMLNEAAGDVIDTHMGKKLISTVHSNERTEERNANEDVVKHIFKKAVEHLAKNGAKYGKDEHFVVTSKKHNRSAAFHYRPDNKSTNDKRSHFIHVSTFPKGEHYVNQRSKGIKVESTDVIEYTIFDVE